MKLSINTARSRFAIPAGLLLCLLILGGGSWAQEDTTVAATEQVTEEPELPAKAKPVKNTFQSVWIIDNQTVMVPVKGTLEFDIMHRFGTWNRGYRDFWGFFAPSNIRLGVNYAPIDKLFVGFGITKEKMLWDLNAKYSIITQTKGVYPVSVTYYGNVGYSSKGFSGYPINKAVPETDELEALEAQHETDKLTFFNQLIIARKITDKFSIQVAPSHSHQNAVGGYLTKNDSTGSETYKTMKHDHFAVSVSARYKLTNVTSVMINYDQPITKHNAGNPHPNLAFGVEFNTSSHSFQLFFGNYSLLSPQLNNLHNTNNPFGKDVQEFLIGFNITRLWNY